MHILGLLGRWQTISAAPMDGAMLNILGFVSVSQVFL
jgi:hypothetical protein